MRLMSIFLVAAVAESVLAAVAESVLADLEQQAVSDKSHERLSDRIKALEDIVRTQTNAIAELVSEKHRFLSEQQTLQKTVKRLETLCSSVKVTCSNDDVASRNEAAGHISKEERESTVNQPHKHAVLVRADDSDPLIPVVTQLTAKVNEVSASLQTVKNEVIEASTSVFVHWGSSTCPNAAALVYSGIVGGSYFDSTGAAVNYLCLPLSDVTLVDGTSTNNAQLYGGEYETQDAHFEKDPLCAVCRPSRSTNVMIPATTVCPAGWTAEYSGVLMGGWPGHNAGSEFICVDSKMEERQGSEENHNGKLLYYTVTVCGSLPCPPYTSGKRVTCVVCSK